MLSPREN